MINHKDSKDQLDDNKLLDAGQAAKFLAERWEMESYSVDAFKMLRHRWGIKPALSSANSTFYTVGQLKTLSRPDKSKPRGPRKKRTSSAVDGSASLMLLRNSADEAGELLSPFEERR